MNKAATWVSILAIGALLIIPVAATADQAPASTSQPSLAAHGDVVDSTALRIAAHRNTADATRDRAAYYRATPRINVVRQAASRRLR